MENAESLFWVFRGKMNYYFNAEKRLEKGLPTIESNFKMSNDEILKKKFYLV